MNVFNCSRTFVSEYFFQNIFSWFETFYFDVTYLFVLNFFIKYYYLLHYFFHELLQNTSTCAVLITFFFSHSKLAVDGSLFLVALQALQLQTCGRVQAGCQCSSATAWQPIARAMASFSRASALLQQHGTKPIARAMASFSFQRKDSPLYFSETKHRVLTVQVQRKFYSAPIGTKMKKFSSVLGLAITKELTTMVAGAGPAYTKGIQANTHYFYQNTLCIQYILYLCVLKIKIAQNNKMFICSVQNKEQFVNNYWGSLTYACQKLEFTLLIFYTIAESISHTDDQWAQLVRI